MFQIFELPVDKCENCEDYEQVLMKSKLSTFSQMNVENGALQSVKDGKKMHL